MKKYTKLTQEQLLSAVWEYSADAMLVIDLEGKVISTNNAYNNLTEFDKESLIGKSFEIVFEKKEQAGLLKYYKEFISSGKKNERMLKELTSKNGKHYSLDASYSLIEMSDEKYVLCIFRDITEQKKAVEALRSSQQIIEGIINAIPVRVFWKDRNLVYLGCNAAFVSDAGFTDPKDIIGKDDYQMGWHDQAELYRNDDRQVIESGCAKLHIEEPQTTPEGKIITLFTNKIPLRNSKGEVNGILGTYMDFTERKQAEEALQKSEEKYRNLVENMGEGIGITDEEEKFIFVNPAAEKIFNVGKGELTGVCLDNFISDENFTIIKNQTAQRRQGKSNSYEIEINLKDGSKKVIFVNATPRFDNNKFIGTFGIFHDFTDRKMAEEKQKLFRTLIDNSNDSIEVVDPNTGRFLDANEKAWSELGYTREEFLTLTVSDIGLIINPSLFAEIKDEIRSLGSIVREGFHQRKDGTTFPVEVNISYVQLNRGYIITMVRDITERKQTEEKTQLLAHTIKSIAEIVTITDLEDKFIFVNQAFCNKYGYSYEEIIGQHVKILQSPNNSPDILKDIFNYSRKDSWKGELLNLTKEGKEFPISLQTSKIINENGDILGLVGISIDITEQKQIEKILRKSEEKYHSIFESTGTATMIVEEDTSISMVNNECYLLTGYNSEELIGTKWTNYVAQESLAEMMKYHNLRRVEPGKAPKKYEVKLLHKTGEVRYAILDIGMIQDTKQSIVSILDITERKRAEEELLKSNSYLSNLIEYTPGAIAVLDENSIVQRINKRFTNYFGYNSQEAVGKCINELIVPKEYYDEANKFCKEYELDRLAGQSTDTIRMDKYGNLKEVSIIGSLIKIDNKFVGIYAIYQDITERKQGEEALKKSEQRFKQVSENASEWIWEVDKNGLYTYANPIVKEILGYEPEEIINKKYFYDFFIPEVREQIKQAVFDVFTRKESFIDLLNSNLHKDGREIILSTSGVPIIDDQGNLLGYRGVDIDITERKQAEESLQKSEEKYRTLVENMGEGIVITDEDENFIFVNPAAEKLFGVGKGELEGECISIFFSKEKFDEVKKRTNERRRGKSGSFEEEIILKDKSRKDIFVTASPWYDDKKFKGTFAIFSDITERKRAEELLKKSEIKYRSLIETMPEGFYRSTTEGYFIDVNPAIVKMLGYDNKEELMKIYIPDELYFTRDERINGANYNIDFIEDTEVYRLKKKDGLEIWVEDHSRYIKDSSGNVLFHEGIMHDVTESLRARNAILEAKEKAEETNRLKSSFLANMSHEIRTPLNGILGFAEILKNELKDSSLFKYVDIIERSGHRLLETLDLILSFSKLEAEKEDVRYSNVLLENVIDETLKSFEGMAKNKNLFLKQVIKNENLITYIDERFFGQIMNNLINNAIKYTKTGGITVSLSKVNSTIVLKVIDTGIGIAKDKHKIIFEEFRQESEGHGRSFQGTGLGLAITKRFVELLKGTIEVESEVGAGSTFTVKLPFEIRPETSNIKIKKEETEKEVLISTPPDKDKLSILLVEDDEASRDYTTALLKKYFNIESAFEGLEAIEKAKEKDYDIILMDINLGKGIDGTEVARKIRKSPGYEKTPIVALTAFVLPGDREEFIAGGCTHYLGKPFTRNQILELLKNITDKI